jgi:acyl-CoA synthetase (AMP-forming)/AMP-acid ligase II
VLAHCARSLARFKWPRFIAYVDEFPRTPTLKIAKAELVRQADDLRTGAYDAVEGVWR